MRSRFRTVETAAVTAVCLFVASAIHATGAFTFQLDPPNGTTCTQAFKVITNVNIAGKNATDVVQGKARLLINRTPQGFTFTFTPLADTLSRQSELVSGDAAAALRRLMQDVVVTYSVDSGGKLLSVHGLETAVQNLRRMIGGSGPAISGEMLAAAEAAEVARARAMWDRDIAAYVGRTAKIGDVWSDTCPVNLLGVGVVPAYTKTKFVKAVKVGEEDCVKVRRSYSAKASSLKSVLNKLIAPALSQCPEGVKPRLVSAQISGTSESLLHPRTMLYLNESEVCSIKLTLDVPGRGKMTISASEKKYGSYQYDE
mgnify:CR=1 FL=1